MNGWQWTFILVLRALAIIYCFQMCVLMLLAWRDHAIKNGLQIHHETLALSLFGVLLFAHGYATLSLCCGCRRKKAKRALRHIKQKKLTKSKLVSGIGIISFVITLKTKVKP